MDSVGLALAEVRAREEREAYTALAAETREEIALELAAAFEAMLREAARDETAVFLDDAARAGGGRGR